MRRKWEKKPHPSPEHEIALLLLFFYWATCGLLHWNSCYSSAMFAVRIAGQTIIAVLAVGLVDWADLTENHLASAVEADRAMWEYDWWVSAHAIPIWQENDAQSVKNVHRHSLFLDQVAGQWENGKRPVGCMCCFQISISKGTCRWGSH